MTKRVTVLAPQTIFDVSFVRGNKAIQRDPEAVIEVVKAELLPAADTAALALADVPAQTAVKATGCAQAGCTPSSDCACGTGCACATDCSCSTNCGSTQDGATAEDAAIEQPAAGDVSKAAVATAERERLADGRYVVAAAGFTGQQATAVLDAATKAAFDTAERERLAKSGAAMSDGSFPIRNASDLHNAMQAVGRAHNPAAAKAHIRDRARALGLTAMLSDAFKAELLIDNSSLGDVEAAQLAAEVSAVTEDLHAAAKAGAEISKKNKSVIQRVLHLLAPFLGEEATEPEHKDLRGNLLAAESLIAGSGSPTATSKAADDVHFVLPSGTAPALYHDGPDQGRSVSATPAAGHFVVAAGQAPAVYSDAANPDTYSGAKNPDGPQLAAPPAGEHYVVPAGTAPALYSEQNAVKAETVGNDTAEEEMDLNALAELMKAQLTEALAPMAERLGAIEEAAKADKLAAEEKAKFDAEALAAAAAAKKKKDDEDAEEAAEAKKAALAADEAAVAVAKAQAGPVISEEILANAVAVYEARKAKGLTPGGIGTTAFPSLGIPGQSELRAIGKATPLEKRPTLEAGLRILTGRDPIYGTLPRTDE